MKKLFFLCLVATGIGSAASAQSLLKRTGKKPASTQQNAAKQAEKMRADNAGATVKKSSGKKVVVITPKAEVITTQ